MLVRRIAAVAAAIVVVGAACSSSDDISVDNAWGRTSPSVATNAAFYMDITGGSEDDALIGASTDVCGMVQIHETVMNDGVMSMQHLPDGVDIPAGETVALEPGGLHVMCMEKQTDLDAGDTVEVTLEFANADDMTVEVEIRDE